MTQRYKFTSESVSEGHPDKMCDQISDAILDRAISQDPNSRVGCETLVKSVSEGDRTRHHVIIAGEVSTSERLDYDTIARDVIRDIGYDCDSLGFNYETVEVSVFVNEQSGDIALGVDEGEQKEQGAGDQGMMFGYACDETSDVLMPWPITYSHRLVRRQAQVRKSGRLSWLGPDAKSQVTAVYENGTPMHVDTIVLSTQHAEGIKESDIREGVIEEIINPVIPAQMMRENPTILINPTGKFVDGGPKADCGLTGRKIIVDTYGGMARHGGGAFSGKDPTKVDRSAAYAMRHVAKNVVAAKLAKRCEVQIAYAIGEADPVSVMVNTFGTGMCEDSKLAAIINELFNLRPKSIMERLDLRRPIYRNTAVYGHFGRNEPDFTWEQPDMADPLASAAGT